MGGCLHCFKKIKIEEENIPKLLTICESTSDNPLNINSPMQSQSQSQNSSKIQIPSNNNPQLSQDIKASLSDFEKLKLLGRGTYGKVLLVKLKINKKLFAMKILDKKLLIKENQIDHTKTERELLAKLNHPFIVKLHYAFQDDKKLYFLTEFMQGGELFFHLRSSEFSKESAVKFYMSEVLLAIEYMHKNNYLYRDLKPENILIDKTGHIKITDFGLSKILHKGNDKTYTMCGTPEYVAPEILSGNGYDKMCDWFSFGVLIFFMLSGRHPFSHKNCKINPNSYSKKIKFPEYISESAKDLICKLLEVNPRKRIDIDEIKSHDFFKDIDFNMVLNKKYTPPFIPKLKNEYDLKYFDDDFIKEKIESIEYNKNNGTPHLSDMFDNFSFQPKSGTGSNNNLSNSKGNLKLSNSKNHLVNNLVEYANRFNDQEKEKDNKNDGSEDEVSDMYSGINYLSDSESDSNSDDDSDSDNEDS